MSEKFSARKLTCTRSTCEMMRRSIQRLQQRNLIMSNALRKLSDRARKRELKNRIMTASLLKELQNCKAQMQNLKLATSLREYSNAETNKKNSRKNERRELISRFASTRKRDSCGRFIRMYKYVDDTHMSNSTISYRNKKKLLKDYEAPKTIMTCPKVKTLKLFKLMVRVNKKKLELEKPEQLQLNSECDISSETDATYTTNDNVYDIDKRIPTRNSTRIIIIEDEITI